MPKLSDAGVEDGWIEREEKLCVVRKDVQSGEATTTTSSQFFYQVENSKTK